MTYRGQRGQITASIAIIILMCLIGSTSYAKDEQPELIKGHATAYCLEGITATGIPVRKGIAAAGRREWLGKTAIVYQRLPNGEIGKIIGIYEIQDTGCKESVIDVWCPEEECQPFMDRVYEDGCQGKVWIQILEAAG